MLTRRAAIASAVAVAASAGTRAQTTEPTVLRVERRTIEVNGKPASVFGIRQPEGPYGLTTEVGKPFRVRVENGIGEPTLVHWHGLTPPWQQDGVPGISGPPIPAGGSAEYDFPLRFGGTFWMHSHEGLQEQRLLSAPLIIHDERGQKDEQEIVLFLADFSFTPPEEILAKLRSPDRVANAAAPPVKPAKLVPLPSVVPTKALGVMRGMKDTKPDLNDVAYDAFLANDRTLADPQVVSVEPGGRLLLRVINGAAMSNFHFDLGPLQGELIAVDGFGVRSVRARQFPIAAAQRLDIRVTVPSGAGSYPVFAVLEGAQRRTGIVLAAGKARIPRIPDTELVASPPLSLEFERELRAAAPLPRRKVNRAHTIDLTGSMQDYVWSLNGVAWNPSVPPLPVKQGERVELVMRNRTMMPHPMHLHGHQFQVVEIDAHRFSGAVRDTVLVPPGRTVTVAFDANNPGWWAFHCHLLYHLDTGMFTTIRYV